MNNNKQLKTLALALQSFNKAHSFKLESKFTASAAHIFNFGSEFTYCSEGKFSVLAGELFKLRDFFFEDCKVNREKYEHDFRFEVYTELFDQLDHFVIIARVEFDDDIYFYENLLENLPSFDENIISFLQRNLGNDDFFLNFGFPSSENLDIEYFNENIDILLWDFICNVRGCVNDSLQMLNYSPSDY